MQNEKLNRCYDELKNKYKAIIEDDHIIITNLISKDRRKIYELLEIKYKSLNKLSVENANDKDKKDIIISINSIINEEVHIFNQKSVNIIFLKIKELKNIELSEYNLGYLEKLYPTIRSEYEFFNNLIRTTFENSIQLYINYEIKIVHQANEELKKYADIFRSIIIDEPNLNKNKNPLYYKKNISERKYLRADIKQANWTVFDRALTINSHEWREFKDNLNINSWEDFMNYVNVEKIDIISKSKKIRQIIFGDLNIGSQLMRHQNDIIKNIYESIDNKNLIKLINNDEIIFEIHDHSDISNMITIINDMFPNIFKFELFKLSYYTINVNEEVTIYKEDHYDIDTNEFIKYNLKGFERKYIVEAIKYLS